MTGNLSASILARLLTLAKQGGDDYSLLLVDLLCFVALLILTRQVRLGALYLKATAQVQKHLRPRRPRWR